MKIAFVYDWIDKAGGVERMLQVLHELYPEAPFYTSVYNPETAGWAKDIDVRTSFLQSFPSFIKNNRMLLVPFLPYAFESFDFSEYDLVISISSAFAKGVITKPKTTHLAIILTPPRFLWTAVAEYLPGWKQAFFAPFLKKLREWDMIAARRPDKLLAISKVVQERCRSFYGLESELLYPPFATQYWEDVRSRMSDLSLKNVNKPYYLVVSRLEPYKKVDLVMRTFQGLEDKNLVIVGEGSDVGQLIAEIRPNIALLGHVSDVELAALYQGAEALIMPQVEDFGYVSLEAQFFGAPVLTYGQSGAAETILEGETGIFIHAQTVASVTDTLETYQTISYNMKQKAKDLGRQQAMIFSSRKFQENLHKIISDLTSRI